MAYDTDRAFRINSAFIRKIWCVCVSNINDTRAFYRLHEHCIRYALLFSLIERVFHEEKKQCIIFQPTCRQQSGHERRTFIEEKRSHSGGTANRICQHLLIKYLYNMILIPHHNISSRAISKPFYHVYYSMYDVCIGLYAYMYHDIVVEFESEPALESDKSHSRMPDYDLD